LTSAAVATAVQVQEGNLRVSFFTQLQPYRLPRAKTAPIAVFLVGRVGSTDGSTPPQLQRLDIEVNRHGRLDYEGLPVCHISQIRAVSSGQALNSCGNALVGSGHFWASVVFAENRPYRTTGRLLAFNGRRAGKPVLLAQIYTTQPFPSSFVVVFAIHHISRGQYSTELTASLPQSLGNWGFVNRIKMTMRRKFHFRGQPHSYFEAGCPAPKGFRATVFPLARATFFFADDQKLAATINQRCGVSE